MKKQLLSTSALVAAGMIATTGSASAQTAPASSPIQITVGGYMYNFFSYTDQDQRVNGGSGGTATVTGAPVNFNVNTDNEIWFQGKTTLANGISVALRVELEANTESDQIDESFAIVEGAFGRIELGSTDNSAYKMSIHAPDSQIGIAVAGVQSYTSNVVANPTGRSGLDTPLATTLPRMGDNDSEKISYYTPRFEGFQLGLSYIPEMTQDRHGIGGVSFRNNTYNNGWSAGLNFTRAFGPIDIAAAAGYVHWTKPATTQAVNNATLSDPHAYTIGAQVGYAGFRLGGSYLKQQDFNAVTAGQTLGGAPMTGVGISAVSDSFNDGYSWDVGLTYTFGPAVVGIAYMDGRARGSSAIGGTTNDNTVQAGNIGGRYQLGPGVQVEASVFHARVRSENSTTVSAQSGGGTNNNNATGVTTGLILNF